MYKNAFDVLEKVKVAAAPKTQPKDDAAALKKKKANAKKAQAKKAKAKAKKEEERKAAGLPASNVEASGNASETESDDEEVQPKQPVPVAEAAPAVEATPIDTHKANGKPSKNVVKSQIADPHKAENSEDESDDEHAAVVEGELSSVASVEAAIRSWDISRAAGMESLMKFNQAMLASQNSDKRLHGLFASSNGLEVFTRKLLDDYLPTLKTSPPRLVQNEITTFFSWSLTGNADYHRWLLDILRSLSKTISLSPKKDSYREKIISVISAQKKVLRNDVEVCSIIANDAVSKHELTARSAEATAKSIKDRELFGETAPAVNDPLYVLWEAMLRTGHEANSTESLLAKYTSGMTSTAQHDLQLAFHLLEKEIQSDIANSGAAHEKATSRQKTLAAQRETLDQQKKARLARLSTSGQDYNTEKHEILTRKAQLEHELATLNRRLELLEANNIDKAQEIAVINAEFDSKLKALEATEAESANQADALTKDHNAGMEIHTLVVQTYERLSEHCRSNGVKLTQLFHGLEQGYLAKLTSHVFGCQDMLTFLDNRIKFCEAKKQQAREEQKQMASLGLPTSNLQEMNQRMSSQIKDDTAVMVAVRQKLDHLFDGLVKLVQPKGGRVLQAHVQMYPDFLAMLKALEERSQGLDLTKVRSLVRQLGDQHARHSAAAPVQPVQPATIAANHTNGTASHQPANGTASPHAQSHPPSDAKHQNRPARGPKAQPVPAAAQVSTAPVATPSPQAAQPVQKPAPAQAPVQAAAAPIAKKAPIVQRAGPAWGGWGAAPAGPTTTATSPSFPSVAEANPLEGALPQREQPRRGPMRKE